MADKSFGAKELNLIKSGNQTIKSIKGGDLKIT